MSKYKFLIFDVDDTLLNFYSAYESAQLNCAQKLGIPYSKEFAELYEKSGWKAWKEGGLDNTESPKIQNNYHTLYYQYLHNHYKYLLQELALCFDKNILVNCYIDSIASSKVFMEPDTLQTYIALSSHYQLVLATNGIEKIQNKRLENLIPFTYKTYISEAIGYIKPSNRFYEYMIRDLDCSPNDCLMVGDSITNDILGAKTAGIDVCFYNIQNKKKPTAIIVDYEIDSIKNLLQILL